MALFIVKRLIQLVPVLIGVLVIAFAVTRLTPGDPAEIMGGLEASDEVLAAIREDMGLNESIGRQLVIYMWDVARGDLGQSFYNGRKVRRIIAETLPRTALLALVAMLFTLAVGIPTGVLSALKKDSWIDIGARSVALIGVSAPPFFASLLMILVFASYVKWFPSYGAGTWKHLVLPFEMLKPRNDRSSGRATALFASLTFSRSFRVRNRLTEAMTRSPARRLRT